MEITFEDFIDLLGNNTGDPSHAVEAWQEFNAQEGNSDMEIGINE